MAAPEKKAPEAPPHWLQSGSPASIDEALRAAELHIKEAEAVRAELEVQKLAGEVARQSLEEQLLEVKVREGQVEVARLQAETRNLEEGTFRSTAYLVVFLLLIIFILVLGLVEPHLLENIGQVFRWAPK
jgi:hypothetical protein